MDEKSINATELIDTLIVDCNETVQAVVSGEYVQFCVKIVDMVQKLTALRDGVEAETRDKDEFIKSLQEIINSGGAGGV